MSLWGNLLCFFGRHKWVKIEGRIGPVCERCGKTLGEP